MKRGDTPSVMAMSWGKGDPHKDSIAVVFLDEAGRLREHTKLDNLVNTENQDEFLDMIKRRRPDVIAVGGFSIATTKLARRIKELIDGSKNSGDRSDEVPSTPVIYVHDDVARILRDQSPVDYREFNSPHRFTVCKTKTDRIWIKLEMSHAICDGSSIPNILNDLARAYEGKLTRSDTGPLFSEFIAHILSSSRDVDVNYWKSYRTAPSGHSKFIRLMDHWFTAES